MIPDIATVHAYFLLQSTPYQTPIAIVIECGRKKSVFNY